MRSYIWGIVLIAFGYFVFSFVAGSYGGSTGQGYVYMGIVLMLLGLVVLLWKPIRRYMLYRSVR